MAAPRQLISDFALENPYYAGAEVTVFTVNTSLTPTTTKATLYAGPTGATTLTNPQVLDSRGKFPQPVYAGEPVSLSVLTAQDTPSPLLLGVQGLVARWRGVWVTGTIYFPGERVRHPTLGGTTYIVAAAHIAGVFVTDVAAGRLVEEIVVPTGGGYVFSTTNATSYALTVANSANRPWVRLTATSEVTIAIPTNAAEAIPVQTERFFEIADAATRVVITAPAGVTLNSQDLVAEDLIARLGAEAADSRGARAWLVKVGTNAWWASSDVTIAARIE